nr:MAG: replication associated protein [Cressdnaviricota sp.]
MQKDIALYKSKLCKALKENNNKKVEKYTDFIKDIKMEEIDVKLEVENLKSKFIKNSPEVSSIFHKNENQKGDKVISTNKLLHHNYSISDKKSDTTERFPISGQRVIEPFDHDVVDNSDDSKNKKSILMNKLKFSKDNLCESENFDAPKKGVRAYVFTCFNELPPAYNEETMKYLGYEAETCPETGRKHWQGFVYWKDNKTITTCVKSLKIDIKDKSCWVGIMKGNFEQNRKYCSKEKGYVCFGKEPHQGAREDLNNLRDDILGGKKVDDILKEDPYMYHQYGRTLRELETLHMREKFRDFQTHCIHIYGDTGTHKSHVAFQNYSNDKCFVYNSQKGWWDGYKQQDTIIINEFRGDIPYDILLQMIDRHPFQVPIRGKENVPFTSKRIIITSCLPLEELYKDERREGDKMEQLTRRIRSIKFDEVNNKKYIKNSEKLWKDLWKDDYVAI